MCSCSPGSPPPLPSLSHSGTPAPRFKEPAKGTFQAGVMSLDKAYDWGGGREGRGVGGGGAEGGTQPWRGCETGDRVQSFQICVELFPFGNTEQAARSRRPPLHRKVKILRENVRSSLGIG